MEEEHGGGLEEEVRGMIISESIRAWVRNHDLQDTLRLIGNGEVIVFMAEDMTTADSMAPTVLTAAYMYFEVERERRSEIGRAVYLDRVRKGEYTPRDYFGLVPGTFMPNKNRKYIVEMFLEAAGGVEPDEIAEWMNDCGLRTTHGNPFTARAVKAILSNPVYCGDVVFHRAVVRVEGHHDAIVSRELWEMVNGKGAAEAAKDQETTDQGEIAA